MLVVHSGAIVAKVLLVAKHPNGREIWLAWVNVGDGQPAQIVFGGEYLVQRGDLVAVARPGIHAVVLDNDSRRRRKMRKRSYRGQPSHGMFCSLDELGWFVGGPNEVAILRDLPVGFCLDALPPHRRAEHVLRPRCFHHLDTADTDHMEPLTDEVLEQIERSASNEVDRSMASI